jgi:hypothetical protein
MSPDHFLNAAAERGLSVAFSIGSMLPSYWCSGGESFPAVTKVDIEHFSQFEAVAWWSIMPEEPIWRAYDNQSANIQQMISSAEALRKYDTEHHPIYVSVVPFYNAGDLAHYTAYIDVIGAEIYPNYAHQPDAWVRYQVQKWGTRRA